MALMFQPRISLSIGPFMVMVAPPSVASIPRSQPVVLPERWAPLAGQSQGPGIFLGNASEALRLPRLPRVHDSPPSHPHPVRSLHGLPPTVSVQLSAADKVYPHRVRRSLESGMLEYIPLDLLTDEACRKAAREPPAPESAFVISNGKLRLPNSTFDSSKKGKLSFDDWCGAAENLVEAMRKHLRAD
ncbi:hypothetical protein C0992_012183 [Termitomyces sp. T32_za158]|nr:hypothetical protein C0992_012182 [Termitomyces sp. T32_za158]KAG6887466.1 hypothetical protein C0992_012183 [Termitomyces sp. T32_za158]